MADRVIVEKTANFLVADAEPRAGVAGAAVEQVLAAYKRLYGGLWVGGRAVLTDRAVTVSANALNRSAHEDGLEPLAVPLSELRSVRVLPAFLTKIVALETDEHTVKLRCWGARSFADKIRAAANLT